MLRAMTVLAAFGGCTLAGLRASQRLRARRDVLRELEAAVRSLLLGVRYTGRPVWELLRRCGGDRTRALFLAAAGAAEAGARMDEAFLAAGAETGLLADLTEGDRRLMADFFAMLGRSGRQAQQESGERILEELSGNQLEAAAVYAGKGRVYRAMGALTGAGVAILLL